jgi:hypothetical protein
MPTPSDLRRLTLSGLAHRCAQETERFFRRESHDSRYCYELFRRAIEERDELAWELIYEQYRREVAGWVQRHPAFAECGEEAQYFVNAAFTKMWVAITPQKFGRFPELPAVLRYLQTCVSGVIFDYVRKAERAEPVPDPEDLLPPPELDEILDSIPGEEIWSLVEERLQDDKERLFVYEYFTLGLKPREIYDRHNSLFSGVQEIHRTRQNVLARLRRDAALRKLLGLGD